MQNTQPTHNTQADASCEIFRGEMGGSHSVGRTFAQVEMLVLNVTNDSTRMLGTSDALRFSF